MRKRIKSLLGAYLPMFVFMALITSCSGSGNEGNEPPAAGDTLNTAMDPSPGMEEQLYQEVMDIHDQAMEGMSVIRRLSRQLNDSIENTGVSPMEQEETINLYRNRVQELKAADEAMRQWMRNFNYKDVPDSAQLEYLREEKEKIEKVDKQMESAIFEAREAMQK